MFPGISDHCSSPSQPHRSSKDFDVAGFFHHLPSCFAISFLFYPFCFILSVLFLLLCFIIFLLVYYFPSALLFSFCFIIFLLPYIFPSALSSPPCFIFPLSSFSFCQLQLSVVKTTFPFYLPSPNKLYCNS